MDNIKPNIGLGDNLANLKEWKQLFGELAQGYIDPAKPRKLAEGEGWGAGTGKLLHKYFFDMPVGALKAMGELYERGMQDPEAIPPLDYTASTLDAMLAGVPGGGTGVANIGKRDALKQLGRSGVKLANKLSRQDYFRVRRNWLKADYPLEEAVTQAEKYVKNTYGPKYLTRVKDSLRSVSDLPQKELDRIKQIYWTETFGTEYGSHWSADKKVQLTNILMREKERKETADTVFHEMTHARQYSPDRKISEIIKARALREASKEMDYETRPIEQLARHTAMVMTQTDMPFEEAYKQTINSYLRNAKAYKDMYTTGSDLLAPDAGQWSKIAPHLKEGIELAKKLPEAKKKIKKLRSVANEADRISLKALGIKPAELDKSYKLSKPITNPWDDQPVSELRIKYRPISDHPNPYAVEGKIGDKWEAISGGRNIHDATEALYRLTDKLPQKMGKLPNRNYFQYTRAQRVANQANRQQVEYHQILSELGLELKDTAAKAKPLYSKDINKMFNELAQAQRGAPESAMLRVQSTMGGGVLNPVVEHAGDLTHRMAQHPDFFKGGFEYVNDKITKIDRYLNQPYGFEKEMFENIANNARMRGISEQGLQKEIYDKLDLYAHEHKQLPVYNEAQRTARDLAVAIGERRWNEARKLTAKLKKHTDQGEKHWSEYALQQE